MFNSLTMFSSSQAFQVYCHLAQEDVGMLQNFEAFIEEAVQKIKETSMEKEQLERIYES